MKVLLLGGNGFIGQTFAKNYHKILSVTIVDQYKSATTLNLEIREIIGDISNKDFLVEISKDFNCIINFAYDRQNLRNNYKIIHNITTACLVNKIVKLIHISTISVYNPFINGILDEKSPYSNLYDPYSFIKRRQERMLSAFSQDQQCCEITILQPTIVYGKGGYWSDHAGKEILKQIKNHLPVFEKDDRNMVFGMIISVEKENGLR